MSILRETTDTTFQTEVLDSPKPAVVDFWAPGCMPCRMMGPIFEQVAVGNAGKIDFFKLNTDMNPGTPLKYRIMGIPSLLIFKNGQEVQRIVGVSSAETLQRELDKVL